LVLEWLKASCRDDSERIAPGRQDTATLAELRSRSTTQSIEESSMRTDIGRLTALIGGFVAANLALGNMAFAASPYSDPANCNVSFVQAAVSSDVVISEAAIQATPVEHCRVIGTITTDNPGPNEVNFKLSMPTDHNKRFYFQGLGGTAGAIPDANPALLERGYAVAVTDTGNQTAAPGSPAGLDWRFMIDEAKALDHDRRAGHVATLAAQAISHEYYGPGRLWRYHSGCSGGGRMGISAAVEYPDDYDGIVLGAAGRTLGNVLHFGKVAQYVQNNIDLNTDPAPVINMVIAGAVIEQLWDAADGAIDGQIWDPTVVNVTPEQFDALLEIGGPMSPEWRTVIDMVGAGYDLRDLGGKVNIGPYYASSVTEWALWTPVEVFPGFNFYFPDQVFGTMSQGAFGLGYDYVANWNFDSPADELDLIDAWSDLRFSKQVEGHEFAEFRDKGGKMIVWHGVHDAAISYSSSVEMYEGMISDAQVGGNNVTRAKQLKKTQKWARFYPVPGIGHCQNGVAGDGPDDTDLAALESLATWVEEDEAPEALIATNATDGRTFNLCPYPGRSVFEGGVDNPDNLDVNDASNWHCEP
jgi:Tannase and feruloyl esterase